MATLRDVADLAGVSTATVSHVVNNSRRISAGTRIRVEAAIAKLNFVPNMAGKLLAQQKNRPRLAVSEPAAGMNTRGGSRAKEIAKSELASASTLGNGGDGASPALLKAIAETGTAPAASTTRILLKVIRAAQPISRAELARRLKVNRSTVTEIVRPLLSSGILREGAPRQAISGRSGRPPVGLSLQAAGRLFIGVNIGVRCCQVGATTADGVMLAEESFDTPAESSATLAQARQTVERICAALPNHKLTILGLSVPGPVDTKRNRLLYAPHLGWRDVAVADALRFPIQSGLVGQAVVPVIVENDATAAAIYEARRRLHDSVDDAGGNFVLVRAGTGIGVGMVLGGEIYRGAGLGGELAGEFGHMTIMANGKACVCGNRGCWERYASAASASSLYLGDRPPIEGRRLPRFVEIVQRAEAGELRAQRTLELVGQYLGIGIGNVITGLGVPRVVVSGRMVHAWRFIETPLREAVARTMAGRLSRWSVEPGCAIGAGLGGAIEVAIEHYLTTLVWQMKLAA